MIAFILVKRNSGGLTILECRIYDENTLRYQELYPLHGNTYQNEADIREEVYDVLNEVCDVIIEEV